jgi:hypothetical protein
MATLLGDSKDGEGGNGLTIQLKMHSYNQANQLATNLYNESITKRFFKLRITKVGNY